MKRWTVISLIFALALCAAVGVALASTSKTPARPHAKAPGKAQAAKATRRTIANAKPVSRPKGVTKPKGGSPNDNTTSDPDNIQQGDQNAPDTNSPTESAKDSESTPGDASVDGVEQPAGADHQCPPDCAPGEQ